LFSQHDAIVNEGLTNQAVLRLRHAITLPAEFDKVGPFIKL
jgi:hypothetical protein